MPDAVVTVVGLDDLQRFFKASGAIMGSAVGHGLVIGGEMVRTEAQKNLQANGSYVTGKLSRSIRRGPVTGQGIGKWVAVGIAPGFGSPSKGHSGAKGKTFNPTGRVNASDPQVYGPIVEKGSKAHVIRPVRAKVLAFPINGETVFARKVDHPGTKGKPFLVPALQDHADKVVAAVMAAVESTLTKARLNRR